MLVVCVTTCTVHCIALTLSAALVTVVVWYYYYHLYKSFTDVTCVFACRVDRRVSVPLFDGLSWWRMFCRFSFQQLCVCLDTSVEHFTLHSSLITIAHSLLLQQQTQTVPLCVLWNFVLRARSPTHVNSYSSNSFTWCSSNWGFTMLTSLKFPQSKLQKTPISSVLVPDTEEKSSCCSVWKSLCRTQMFKCRKKRNVLFHLGKIKNFNKNNYFR